MPMPMRFGFCQSARLRLRVSSHGLSKPSLEREFVIATVSGWATPVEYGRSRNSPRRTNGSEDRRSSAPAAMGILATHWKTSSRVGMPEDDECTLRANSKPLGSQTKYWRLIMQYDSEMVCSRRGVAPGEQWSVRIVSIMAGKCRRSISSSNAESEYHYS